MTARLIALDWGTTFLRAFLMGDDGAVLDQRTAPKGIMQVPEGGFPAAFADITADWRLAAPDLPALAAGMVGSAQGWRQTPYCHGPTNLAALAAGLITVPTGHGPDLHIVPGIAMHTPRPELMRGEETQIFGALSFNPELRDGAKLVMPGTHCKWVSVRNGGIALFQTFLTGELFAALKAHTILGRPARDAGTPPATDSAAFTNGVIAARETPDGITPLLFSARSLVLTGRLPAADSLEYLSGLLIGDELRCALQGRAPQVALIGDPALCDRYRRALAVFGVTGTRTITGATEAGLWQVACQAGLVPAIGEKH